MRKAKTKLVADGRHGQNVVAATTCPPCLANDAASPGVGGRRCSLWLLGLEWLALVGAVTLGMCLAWRPMASVDLGYHLAYGDYLLEHKRIVDWNEFIYTPARYAGADEAMNIGPGCWYEQATGRYRFPNANWASQACMAMVAAGRGKEEGERGREGEGEPGHRTPLGAADVSPILPLWLRRTRRPRLLQTARRD